MFVSIQSWVSRSGRLVRGQHTVPAGWDGGVRVDLNVVSQTISVNLGGGGGRVELTMDIRKSDACNLRPVQRKFAFCLSLHHPNNSSENISIFLFAPVQLCIQKERKTFLGKKKILEGAYAPPPFLKPPKSRVCPRQPVHKADRVASLESALVGSTNFEGLCFPKKWSN
jgi:hypothetical protein